MGLDITVYRQLRAIGPKTDGSEIRLSDNPDFPGRSEGVDFSQEYEAAEIDGFPAGSYGGYNAWRDELARLVGWADAKALWMAEPKDGPFVELINFADNEGVIGPVVSAKLAKDFADYQSAVDAKEGDAHRLLSARYSAFRHAFEMAADGGAVAFH